MSPANFTQEENRLATVSSSEEKMLPVDLTIQLGSHPE